MTTSWPVGTDVIENGIVSRWDGPPPSDNEYVAYFADGYVFSSTGTAAEGYLRMGVKQFAAENPLLETRLVRQSRAIQTPRGSGHMGRVRFGDDMLPPNLYVIATRGSTAC